MIACTSLGVCFGLFIGGLSLVFLFSFNVPVMVIVPFFNNVHAAAAVKILLTLP
jgi:hypothetical protein